MTNETKSEKSKRLKMAVIIGHRKRMGLCIACGKEIHDASIECIHDYKKADNRQIQIEGKLIDIQRKKDTIISYRRRKKLCVKCGKELHNNPNCIETYEQVDNRTIEERKDRPAIIATPKTKSETILNEIITFNSKEIKIQLQKTAEVILQRAYIVLCINKSTNGNIIEYSCLNQLSKKYPHYIICIVGNIEKEFPFSDVLKIKKLINIRHISNDQQEIVNYLWNSKGLFSFENDYTDYCKKNKIPVFIFEKDKNATNFLKDTAFQF